MYFVLILWIRNVHLFLHQCWKTHFAPLKALSDDTFTVSVRERHLSRQADVVPVWRRKLQLSSEDLIKQLLLHVVLTGERKKREKAMNEVDPNDNTFISE